MREHLFYLNPEHTGTLQAQVRELIVCAILDGHFPVNEKVPSPRKLALELRVARNTVIEAYQHLVDTGYLASRQRSGYYVTAAAHEHLAPLLPNTRQPPLRSPLDWASRVQLPLKGQSNIVKPHDWSAYTYPFISGQIDIDLFPAADWRDCCRYTMGDGLIQNWVKDQFDTDTPALVDQLRTRVLPQRGVYVAQEEILVTMGAQHALYMLASLLMRGKRVGMEEPGYPDARNIFALKASRMIPLPVDAEGLIVDERLAECEYVYVTPSHQKPTTVTLSLARRKALMAAAEQYDFVIIEDDYEGEVNYIGTPTPALSSMDTHGRVVYVGSLSKTLAPGLRLGYLVAAEELIQEARALRRLMLRHPPGNNESIVALFLARGYHDAFMRRLRRVYCSRWQVMQDALEKHLPDLAHPTGFGGSAFWLQGLPALDCRALQRLAARHQILIEPGHVYFMQQPTPLCYFRLGFSSIPEERIEAGVAKLAGVIRGMG